MRCSKSRRIGALLALAGLVAALNLGTMGTAQAQMMNGNGQAAGASSQAAQADAPQAQGSAYAAGQGYYRMPGNMPMYSGQANSMMYGNNMMANGYAGCGAYR